MREVWSGSRGGGSERRTTSPADPEPAPRVEVGEPTHGSPVRCRHSTMFGKSIAHFGVPAYGPPRKIHRLGRLFNHVVRGPSAYASILVAEEILDTWQRELMKDERVQPITRMVARIHVLEEARHMTFARDEVRPAVEGLSKRQLVVQQHLTAQTCLMVARSLVNPRVYHQSGSTRARDAARRWATRTTARRCSGWARSRSRSSARTACSRRARSASGGPRCCCGCNVGRPLTQWSDGLWGHVGGGGLRRRLGRRLGPVRGRRGPSRSTVGGTSRRGPTASTEGSCSASRLRSACAAIVDAGPAAPDLGEAPRRARGVAAAVRDGLGARPRGLVHDPGLGHPPGRRPPRATR